MLAALLANDQYVGTGDVTQPAQSSEGVGGVLNFYGACATAQAAQTTQASGQFGVQGAGTSAQDPQVTQGSSSVLIVGSGDSIQRAQRTRGAGTGPARGTPRPLRISRGDSDPKRPVILTIKTGA